MKQPWEMTKAEWTRPELPSPKSPENIILYHVLDKPEHLDSVLQNGLLLSKKSAAGEGGKGVLWFATNPEGYSKHGTIIGVEVPKTEANLGWSGQGQARVARDIKPSEIVFVDKEGSSPISVKERIFSERKSDAEADVNDTTTYHKEYVKQAISEGKPVPPEVLAEYPDLAQTHTMPTGETMPGPEHPGAVPGTTRPVSDAMRAKADELDAAGSENLRKGLTTSSFGAANYEAMVGAAQKTAALMLRVGAEGVDFAQWSKQMIDEYGPEIEPKLDTIWRMANSYHAAVVQQQPKQAPSAQAAPTATPAAPVSAPQAPGGAAPKLEQVGDVTPPVSEQNTISMFNATPSMKQKAESMVAGKGGLLPDESFTHRVSQHFGEKWSNRFNRLLYATRRLEVAAKRIGNLKPEENPWSLFVNLTGFNNKFHDALDNGMPGARGQGRISEAPSVLFDIIKPLSGEFEANYDMAEQYAVAKRTLAEYNKKLDEANSEPDIKTRARAVAKVDKQDAANQFSGIGQSRKMKDTEAATWFLNNIPMDKREAMESFATKYKELADAPWKYALAKGLISLDKYNEIVNSRDAYASFKRWYQDDYAVAYKQTHGTEAPAIEQDIMQHYKGSARPIESPTLGLALMWNKIMHEADRNEMMTALYDLNKSAAGEDVRWGGVMKEVPKGTKGAITIWKDGVGHDVLFEPMLHKQLKGLTEADIDFGQLAKGARFVRNMITYTPPFALMNWARAAAEYPLLSENIYSPLSPTGRTLQYAAGGAKELTSEAARYGLGAQWYMKDRVSYIKELTNRANEIVRENKGVLLWPHKIKDGYSHLITASELGPRLSEYAKAKKYAKEKLGYDEHNASIYAAGKGADLPNFAIAGTWMKKINSVVPFSNAAVQSFMRFGKTFKQSPGKFATLFAIGFVLPRILEYEYAAQDPKRLEEFQGLPSWWRDMFLNFKIGDGKDDYIRIPLGFEAATLSGAVSRGLDLANGNEDAFRDYDKSLLQQFIPFNPEKIILNSWLATPFELAGNKEYFTGRYIVSPREEGKAVPLRTGTKYASSLSKYLSKIMEPAVEVDPRNIDFTIKKLFGRVGTMATSASSVLTGEKPVQSAFGAWSGMIAPHSIYADSRVQYVMDKFKEYNETGSREWKDISQRLADIQALPPGKQRDEMKSALYKTLAVEISRFKKIEQSSDTRRKYMEGKIPANR